MPWGPIVAFLVASPLSSPSEFAYPAGFFGFRFAAFQMVWSAVLGLAAGLAADYLDRRGILKGQALLLVPAPDVPASPTRTTGSKLAVFIQEFRTSGSRILAAWALFAVIGAVVTDAEMGLGAVMVFRIILLVGGMAGGWLLEVVTAFPAGG